MANPQWIILPLCVPEISSWLCASVALLKKVTNHQVTTMLATAKNVLFPGHNHLLTTGADDPSLTGARAII